MAVQWKIQKRPIADETVPTDATKLEEPQTRHDILLFKLTSQEKFDPKSDALIFRSSHAFKNKS